MNTIIQVHHIHKSCKEWRLLVLIRDYQVAVYEDTAVLGPTKALIPCPFLMIHVTELSMPVWHGERESTCHLTSTNVVCHLFMELTGHAHLEKKHFIPNKWNPQTLTQNVRSLIVWTDASKSNHWDILNQFPMPAFWSLWAKRKRCVRGSFILWR